MMTSSNGNIFRLTGQLCREYTVYRWIPRTKASDTELLVFSLVCAWINGGVNNREAGDLRRHRAHYDVIVMHIHVVMKNIYLIDIIWWVYNFVLTDIYRKDKNNERILSNPHPKSYQLSIFYDVWWWRHYMEMLSTLRAPCDRNPRDFLIKALLRSFDIFVGVKLLNKQLGCRWVQWP